MYTYSKTGQSKSSLLYIATPYKMTSERGQPRSKGHRQKAGPRTCPLFGDLIVPILRGLKHCEGEKTEELRMNNSKIRSCSNYSCILYAYGVVNIISCDSHFSPAAALIIIPQMIIIILS